MTEQAPMIELDGVTKRFGREVAVDGISLVIPQGELCVLVGTSGCGKSTTLRMINRLIEHSAGEIRIEGRQVRSFNEERLRRRIGYAIQSTGLFPHWSVARNIGLVPRLLRWPKERIDARVSELMALLGLAEDEFAAKFPDQLSGGQAQRVGVARALAADPDILLMDEPFGALDPITRENLQDELLRIQGHLRKTIVFVTHGMDEALKLADRIVVMDAGRIVQQGTPSELIRAPAGAFVESLLGGSDRGLKQAALSCVADRMRRLTVQGAESKNVVSIGARASLREAISLMLWHGIDSLAVTDEAGQLVGTLSLHDAVVGGQP